MDDLEITKLCAEAMGLTSWQALEGRYDPLHDDAQAMALVKKFRLEIRQQATGTDEHPGAPLWGISGCLYGWKNAEDENLNRAICECVARMQAAK